jgi:macrolide transport system ATP-binding/permease protein
MEKVCLELENIELSFLDRLVLNIPRLAVHQFDRIGIVGKNGERSRKKLCRFCLF